MRAFFVVALSLVAGVLGAPSMSPRAQSMSIRAETEDWKTKLGWDGKTTTPAQLDPSNAVKPTPGKPAPAALPGGVYFCTDKNWSGVCAYVSGMNDNQCVAIGSDFNDKITSFGPDSGIGCTLYSDAGCQGRSFGFIVNPGFYDLSASDVNFNDITSSFRCNYA